MTPLFSVEPKWPILISISQCFSALLIHEAPSTVIMTLKIEEQGLLASFLLSVTLLFNNQKRWLCCFSLQPPYKEDLEIKFLGKGLSKIQSILSKISYPCKPSLSSSTWEHPSCCFFLPLGQFLPSLGTSSTLPKIEGSSYFPHFVFSPCVIILVPQKASPITGGKGEKGEKGEQSMLQGNLHAN